MKNQPIEKVVKNFIDLGLEFNISEGLRFFDEPRFFHYTTRLKNTRKYTDGYIKEDIPPGSGFSLISPNEALSKSVYEAIERWCLTCYRRKDIKFKKNKPNKKFVELSCLKDQFVNNKEIGWVNVHDLFSKKEMFLPAQIVYLNYLRRKSEPILSYPRNSNGAAAGKTRDQAVLNGIYEVIERDSFMSIYLNCITPAKLDLESFKDEKFKYILDKCKRYNLELYLLDITTDVGIPSYLSVLIDRTGFGPAISLGAKSGFRFNESALGAISESFMTRQYVKYMLKDGVIFGSKEAKRNTVFAERAEYWFTKEKIKDISFLLSGRSIKKRKEFKGSTKDELKFVSNILRQRGFNIYVKDITQEHIKGMIHVYKVVIPGLQSLYLKESDKTISLNHERLKNVASFFNSAGGINPFPHPFL